MPSLPVPPNDDFWRPHFRAYRRRAVRLSVTLRPTLWDPLILTGVVAWAHPLRDTDETDALGRPRRSARAGIAFDYPTPDATFAMFEMLVATAFE